MRTVIKPEPVLIVLGVSEAFKKLSKPQQCFLSYALIIAIKLILTLWRSANAPTSKMWLEGITNTLHLERIRRVLKDRLQHFNKTWTPPYTLHCEYKSNWTIRFLVYTAQSLAYLSVRSSWVKGKGEQMVGRVGSLLGWRFSQLTCRVLFLLIHFVPLFRLLHFSTCSVSILVQYRLLLRSLLHLIRYGLQPVST